MFVYKMFFSTKKVLNSSKIHDLTLTLFVFSYFLKSQSFIIVSFSKSPQIFFNRIFFDKFVHFSSFSLYFLRTISKERSIGVEMATKIRTAEALERKIEKHIKEHADDMKTLKTEIQNSKIIKPKIQKEQQAFNNGNKRLIPNAKNENCRKLSTAKPLKNIQCDSKVMTPMGTTVENNPGDKATTNKMVIIIYFLTQPCGCPQFPLE